jgi:hypothetical protein
MRYHYTSLARWQADADADADADERQRRAGQRRAAATRRHASADRRKDASGVPSPGGGDVVDGARDGGWSCDGRKRMVGWARGARYVRRRRRECRRDSVDGPKWAHPTRFWTTQTEPCSMRQGACLIWTSLVIWYPAGLPQTGTL